VLLCMVMLYFVAKPSHVEADMEGLACSLHCPMVYNHQGGGQSFLTSVVPSCHAIVGGGAFLGDAKPMGLDILHGVDRPSICETKSYMEKATFTKVWLSDVRVIMVIMCVPLVELLCQAVMGWILALEYLLLGMCGACGHILSC
jgi:hypothetical protein